MKQRIFFIALFGMFSGIRAQTGNTTDEGVEINGVIWATRNVGAPNTFVDKPEDFGEYYQWNKGTPDFLQNNDYYESVYAGTDVWLPENDPCPCGWRVPAVDELNSLLNGSENWTHTGDGSAESLEGSTATVNGKTVYQFISGSDTLFLPGAGVRQLLTGGVLDGTGSGHYWSSTPYENVYARHLNLMNLGAWTTPGTGIFRANGHSVRCVKQEEECVTTSVNEISSEKDKTVIGWFNFLGQKLPEEPQNGIFIILYDDGTSEKRMK